MDVFKFAFETAIVGILALPWLLILTYLFSADSLTSGHSDGSALLSSVPENIRQPVANVLLFAVVYVVGSAVSPLARDALDDDDLALFGRKLPTERRIRQEVYCEHNVWLPYAPRWLPQEGLYLKTLCPADGSDTSKADTAASTEVFRSQETAVLLETQSQRIRQLHEEIIVLQGAVFSALLCALLCLLGWSSTRWPKSIWAAIAPLLILTFAGFSLFHHISDSKKGFRFDDPPLMEFVLLLVGLVGAWTVFHPPRTARRFGSWALAALLLGMVTYGGWWWAQVNYLEHVIHTFAALPIGKQ